jgi:hypothetical protein
VQQTKEIRWYAMELNLKQLSITGIPFVVDPYTDHEEPELLANGDVPMVQFHFIKDDFQIIRDLVTKMTPISGDPLNMIQWEIEALGKRLLSTMLKEYIEQGETYRLSPEFKHKAQELIAREIEKDPSKMTLRSRDVRCPYCERMTTFIEGCTKGICQFCGQSMEVK